MLTPQQKKNAATLAQVMREDGKPRYEYREIAEMLGLRSDKNGCREISKAVNGAGIRRMAEFKRNKPEKAEEEPLLKQEHAELFKPQGNEFLMWVHREIERAQSVSVGNIDGILNNIKEAISKKIC